MAVIKHGSLIADIRGKVGDVVYSRGQGGPIARCIGVIDSLDTIPRQTARANLAAVAAAWSGTLSAAQRNGWTAYAHRHPRPNRWGQQTQASGYLAFLRHNLHIYREVGDIVFPDAPTAPPLHPAFLTIRIRLTDHLARFSSLPSNYPAPCPRLFEYAFAGQQLNPGRSYYSGPWRYLGVNETTEEGGNQDADYTWPWPLTAGHTTRAYAVVQDANTGSISTRAYLVPTIGAFT